MIGIAVSNIAWPAALDREAYHLLAACGVTGIEVAPTRVWPEWQGITVPAVGALRAEIEAAGLRISSLQAILFQKPELQLFSQAEAATAFAEHLRFCAGLAVDLGACAVVFGAPKNRDRGTLSEADAFDRAVSLFSPVARDYAAAGVALALEANPPQYGCNFLTLAKEAAALVRAVASPGLRLHLDTACAAMAGEEIAQLVRDNADILVHFHASEPMLGAVGGAVASSGADHAEAAAALAACAYPGWVAVEMRAQQDVESSLRTAAEFALATYGGAA